MVGCSMQSEPAPDEAASLTLALDTTRTGVWEVRDWGDISFDNHARFVYHAAMSRVLLVSAWPNRGVYAWDGRDWDRLSGPSSSHFMQGAAYDANRERVVVFGGLEADHVGAGNSRNTWFWVGGAWETPLLSGPPAGGGATLVYDAARDRTVLTGGAKHTNGTPSGETWLFDGKVWTKAAVAESPASQYAGAAYDQARELVVGVRPVDGTRSETWEWNGAAWRRIDTLAPLPYEYSYTLTYDAMSMRVVALVDGALWGWDGSTWSRVDASDGRESERNRAVIAYDAARDRVVAHNASTSTWEYDGASWHKLASTRPRARQRAASAYDSARRRAVFFGATSELEDATWEWDGVGWGRGAEAVSATPTGLAMAYDSKRARMVVVVDHKTWEHDGTGWHEVGTGPGSVALLAFDAARGLTVALIGSATWTWDGASWSQVMVAGPTAARDSAMAYDAQRERIVRFGGYLDGTGSSQIDETWEWDGSSWTLSSPHARPAARGGHAMAFDSRRGRIVLYGGYRHREVWEYDGITWVQRVTPTAPPGSFSNGLVYDALRDRMVFYASDGTLWEYHPVGDACVSGDECPSGACVAGVCCDRACTSSCETCSAELGASQNGVCELIPDAGAECMSSEMEGGVADGSASSADGGARVPGKGGGGCSVAHEPMSDAQGLIGTFFFAALTLRGRRRRGKRPGVD